MTSSHNHQIVFRAPWLQYCRPVFGGSSMKDRLCNHNWNCEILSKWSRSTCNNGLNPLFPDEFGNGSGQELSRVHVKKEGYRDPPCKSPQILFCLRTQEQILIDRNWLVPRSEGIAVALSLRPRLLPWKSKMRHHLKTLQ